MSSPPCTCGGGLLRPLRGFPPPAAGGLGSPRGQQAPRLPPFPQRHHGGGPGGGRRAGPQPQARPAGEPPAPQVAAAEHPDSMAKHPMAEHPNPAAEHPNPVAEHPDPAAECPASRGRAPSIPRLSILYPCIPFPCIPPAPAAASTSSWREHWDPPRSRPPLPRVLGNGGEGGGGLGGRGVAGPGQTISGGGPTRGASPRLSYFLFIERRDERSSRGQGKVLGVNPGDLWLPPWHLADGEEEEEEEALGKVVSQPKCLRDARLVPSWDVGWDGVGRDEMGWGGSASPRR